VLDEHVPFFERALVEQHFEALASGQFALGVLGINALLPTTKPRRSALVFELDEDVLHGVLIQKIGDE
jgi:hypothetical protein